MNFQYEFKGNKPSKAKVKKILTEAIDNGNNDIQIIWGENGLEFDITLGICYGNGWIKDISAHDLANELNRASHNKTLNLWNT